jgi:hypothetical protein
MGEYILRMWHNSPVLIEWGNMEVLDKTTSRHAAELENVAQELVPAATDFRLYSLLALAKLKLWIVFRLDASASLPRLRRVFGIDAMASYRRLKTATGSLGLAHGSDYHQLLARL